MRPTICLSALLALSAAATVASAGVIPFDPDGPGSAPAVQVGSFDFLPGNLLLVPDQASTNYTLYYQARLGALLDGAGNVIPTPGLNGPAGNAGSYEITAAFGIAVTSTTGTASLQFSRFAPLPGASYYSLYFDRNVDASDLAGTGFRNGVNIYSGNANFALGTIGAAPTGSLPLDLFGADNYPGLLSVLLSGGLKVGADTLSQDPNFFLAPTSSLFTDTTASDPFFHTNPSASFEIGPDGLTVAHPINLGPVHSARGDEILVESDGSTTFILAPEPASLSLLALGAAPLLRRRRK